ncbi:MAG: hypothetical protein WAK20_19975 [Candidatus Acidiferrum sp.]
MISVLLSEQSEQLWNAYARSIILQYVLEAGFVSEVFPSWIYFGYYVPRPRDFQKFISPIRR